MAGRKWKKVRKRRKGKKKQGIEFHFFYQLPSVVLRHMHGFLEMSDVWTLTRTFPLLLEDSLYKEDSHFYERYHLLRCDQCDLFHENRCVFVWEMLHEDRIWELHFSEHIKAERQAWVDKRTIEFFQKRKTIMPEICYFPSTIGNTPSLEFGDIDLDDLIEGYDLYESFDEDCYGFWLF